MKTAIRARALAPVACLLGVLLLAVAASAQSDVMCFCPEDDSDADCGGNIDIPAFDQRTIYLCVINPSGPEVKAWEANIEIEGASNMTATWTMLGIDPINFASSPEYIVGVALNPLQPDGNVIPLLAITALVFNEEPIRFFIRGVSNSTSFPYGPGYSSDVGVEYECTPCGSDDFPSFTINWAAIDESRAWGEVKNLFED